MAPKKQQADAMVQFEGALDRSSWDNLLEAYPVIAESMAEAVSAGCSAPRIYASVIRAGHSPQLARWCRSAAQHLISLEGE